MTDAFLKKAKAKAAKYCASRERAPFQVMEKLLSWDIQEAEAHDILAELIEENFVDEQRFCRAFCHDKFEFNQWGKNRIKMELTRFRLPETIIEEGLDAIDPKRYQEVLHHVGQKKLATLSGEQDFWKKKQKLVAYLIRKGFEADLVYEEVNTLLADRD